LKKKFFSVLFALVLVASFSLVMAVPAAAATLTVDTSLPDAPPNYHTIQAAIDAASDGDTIIVSDGTYPEDLTVDTANLTLKSVNGSGSTTIQGVDDVVIELMGGSGGFTLGDAVGAGFTVIGHATASTVLFRTQGGPAGVTLSYNDFDTSSDDNTGTNMAIAVGAGGIDRLNISHNTFELYRDTAGNNSGIYFDCDPITNLVVNRNTFEGRDSHAAWINCVVDAGIDGATVSNNTVTNAVLNMRMQEAGTPRTNPLNNIAITDNTFNGGSEIFIGPGAAGIDNVVSNLSVTGNNVNADDRYGPNIGDCPFFEILGPTATQIDWGTVKVNYNNFNLPSPQWAVKNNTAGTSLDAENNWWGNASGPSNVGPGTGAMVSANVDYTPWLGEEYAATKSVGTATGTGTASFSPDSGALEDLTSVPENSLPTQGKPNLLFPHGFFSFNIVGLTPGQTVIVTITLPDAVPIGTQYWKYHASEGGWIQIPMGSDNGDNVITITLVDGGLGDDDGVANGVIVDQGGPGNPPPPPPPPPPYVGAVGGEFYPVNKANVLAPWLGLALILAIGGSILVMRRRRAN